MAAQPDDLSAGPQLPQPVASVHPLGEDKRRVLADIRPVLRVRAARAGLPAGRRLSPCSLGWRASKRRQWHRKHGGEPSIIVPLARKSLRQLYWIDVPQRG